VDFEAALANGDTGSGDADDVFDAVSVEVSEAYGSPQISNGC
jgi:hypothetical protein